MASSNTFPSTNGWAKWEFAYSNMCAQLCGHSEFQQQTWISILIRRKTKQKLTRWLIFPSFPSRGLTGWTSILIVLALLTSQFWQNWTWFLRHNYYSIHFSSAFSTLRLCKHSVKNTKFLKYCGFSELWLVSVEF